MGYGVLLLALLLQGKPVKLEIAAREVPGGRKPVFEVRGTTDLPDGARLELTYYYKHLIKGSQLEAATVLVEDGAFVRRFERFATEHSVFPDRNLSGTWHFRAYFTAGLQKSAALQEFASADRRVKLRIGDARTEREDRMAVQQHLLAAVRRMGKIAGEIEDKVAGGGGVPWKKLHAEWKERCHRIERRVHRTPEYEAIKISHLADLERLRDHLLLFARLAESNNVPEMRRGRIRITRSLQECQHALSRMELTRSEALTLAEEAARTLRASAGLEGDALDASRRKFLESLLALGGSEIARAYLGQVQKILREAPKVYAAAGAGSDEAARLRSGLESEMADLIDALQEDE